MNLFHLQPNLRQPKPKLPPDPFFDMSEEEYQIHRARRMKACREAEMPAGILAAAFILLTLLCISLAIYVSTGPGCGTGTRSSVAKHGGFHL